MSRSAVTLLDQKLARLCELCPLCRHARQEQNGFANTFVRSVETAVCPFCRAYERVHGSKAHEANDNSEPKPAR